LTSYLPPNIKADIKSKNGNVPGNKIFLFKESWDLVLCIMVGTFKAVKSLYDTSFYKIKDLDYTTKCSYDIPAMYLRG
jgi:hypothetical protein